MKKDKPYIDNNIAEVSGLLCWSEQTIRLLARQGRLTFCTALFNEDKNRWTYYVDVQTFNKCLNGEKELFRC